MRLYHYTAREHAREIQILGLNPELRPTYVALGPEHKARGVWLTDDPDWSQPWATKKTINCDRTEVRFTLTIPKAHRGDLHNWPDVAARIPAPPDWLQALSQQGGGQDVHWFVYFGRIPAGWLRGLEERPGLASADAELARSLGIGPAQPVDDPSVVIRERIQ